MSFESKPTMEHQEYIPEIMSYEEYGKSEHSTPYVFEFKKGNKELVYFGASHSYDPSNPMFAELKEKFISTQPDSMFIEGWNSVEEINLDPVLKAKAIEYMKNMTEEEVIRLYGEPGYGIKLAIEAGISFHCPEPKFEDEVKDLLTQGFTKDQVFAHYFYRMLPQYYRSNEEVSVEEYMYSFIKKFEKDTKWEGFDYSLDRATMTGEQIWGKDADIHNAAISSERDDPVPWVGRETPLTVNTEMSQRSSYFRDVAIVKNLKQAMEAYDRPFVVFGASHAYMEKPALEKLFS